MNGIPTSATIAPCNYYITNHIVIVITSNKKKSHIVNETGSVKTKQTNKNEQTNF